MPNNLFSAECEDLLKRLLKRNPLERLGANAGAHEIKAHPWFREVDWGDVYKKRAFAPRYPARSLKPRQDRIDMEALTAKGHQTSGATYKEKELERVKNWSIAMD